MTPLKKTIYNRMMRICRHCIDNKISDSQTDWCRQIGIAHQNLAQVRRGAQSFTHDQIYKAAIMAGVSIDFVYGFTNTMKKSVPKTPLELARALVIMLETNKKQL